MFSEVAEIALVAARLGQFQQLLKTRVILILNFTRPRAITYTNRKVNNISRIVSRMVGNELYYPPVRHFCPVYPAAHAQMYESYSKSG